MLTDRFDAAVSRRTRTGVVLLTSVALLATTFQVHAAAAPSPVAKSELVSADGTDFSARKRHRRGNAAGVAMMGMMVGAIGGMIAAQQRREAAEEAYNRAYGYQYYPYAQPRPYVGYHQPRYHQPRYQQPHVPQPQGQHGFRMDDGRPPGGPIINNSRAGW